jgi:hypothetical protein
MILRRALVVLEILKFWTGPNQDDNPLPGAMLTSS